MKKGSNNRLKLHEIILLIGLIYFFALIFVPALQPDGTILDEEKIPPEINWAGGKLCLFKTIYKNKEGDISKYAVYWYSPGNDTDYTFSLDYSEAPIFDILPDGRFGMVVGGDGIAYNLKIYDKSFSGKAFYMETREKAESILFALANGEEVVLEDNSDIVDCSSESATY